MSKTLKTKNSPRIRITVIADDIAHAMPGDGDKCAIALAAQRRFQSTISVGNCTLIVGKTNKKWSLPKRARIFIKQFDSRKAVSPFTFYLTSTLP